jgi:hypothetical protein
MTRSLTRAAIALLCLGALCHTPRAALAQDSAKPEAADAQAPIQILTSALNRWSEIIQPPAGRAPRTFVTRVRVTRADGMPGELENLTADVAFQAPDRLRVVANVGGQTYAVGRDGQQLWVDIPHKQFTLVGRNGVPRFKTHPNEPDTTQLPPFAAPIPAARAGFALAVGTQLTALPPRQGHPRELGVRMVGVVPQIQGDELKLWLREADLMPVALAFRNEKNAAVEVEFQDPRFEEPWPAEKWAATQGEGEKVETVALAHLVRFLKVAPDALFNNQIPTLGPATGAKRVIARDGEGRLEDHDGTRVLFLKGSPAEMGRQHGRLLKPQILHAMDRILYGVGVGSSFDRGNWFFGEIEAAQARVEPYCDPRYLEEMDAIAAAVGAHRQEARLSNFFPELFHCSGFSIFGKATKDGRMYHGRILDYMKGVGLEQNAVVIVHQPDAGRNAWVNISYAGFVGSVTAMNEKHISLGEMGGGGYGNWDGKPMAQLVRDVMEKAGTLEEAVEIMRKGPRTCEYYYVVSDGKTKDAVGIAATPDTFEIVRPGQSHPRLPHTVPDAVLLSAGDRYEELARRVRANYGKFDAEGAIRLMSRPVCMTSNIHSVLFAPDTLEFWVANADSKNPASHARFTHYDLRELLESAGTAQAADGR